MKVNIGRATSYRYVCVPGIKQLDKGRFYNFSYAQVYILLGRKGNGKLGWPIITQSQPV